MGVYSTWPIFFQKKFWNANCWRCWSDICMALPCFYITKRWVAGNKHVWMSYSILLLYDIIVSLSSMETTNHICCWIASMLYMSVLVTFLPLSQTFGVSRWLRTHIFLTGRYPCALTSLLSSTDLKIYDQCVPPKLCLVCNQYLK